MQHRPLPGAQRRLALLTAPLLALLCSLILAFTLLHHPLPAHAAGGLPSPWWHTLSTQRTLNAVNYGHTLQYVQSNLDTYQAEGYQVINLDWPVSGGPTAIYGGFAGVDYYHVDPRLADAGTDPDTAWANFTAAAHSRGMAVDSWFNPSYIWTGAPLFKQAEADVLQYGTVRANLPANSPARYFDWRSQAGTITKPCDSCGGSGGQPTNAWITNPAAGSNASYYSVWASQPTGDFNSTEWRTYIKGAIHHWMDTGLDGFIFDDPRDYYHCDSTCFYAVLLGPINDYGNKAAFSENGGAGFDGSFGQNFGWQDAITNQNPSQLNSDLANRDNLASGGDIAIANLDTQLLNDNAKNLLAAATITSSGNLLDIHATGMTGGYEDFGDFGVWPDAATAPKLKAIADAIQNTPSFDLTGTRTPLTTNNDNKYFAYLRSLSYQQQKALVVLNYQGSQQTITVNVSNQGIIAGQTATDLINGGNGPTLSGTNFTVTLPAWGYGFYGLTSTNTTSTATPTATPPPPIPTIPPGSTLIDDNASGWTYNGLTAYSDGAAYQGTGHGSGNNGDYGQYTFTGTRVDVFSWKGSDAGTVQVCVEATCRPEREFAHQWLSLSARCL